MLSADKLAIPVNDIAITMGKLGKLLRQAFLLKSVSYEKTLPKQQNKNVFLKSTVILISSYNNKMLLVMY